MRLAAVPMFYASEPDRAISMAAESSKTTHGANLGNDADTTGAVYGQFAGAFYGMLGISPRWLDCLYDREEIDRLATDLFVLSGAQAALA